MVWFATRIWEDPRKTNIQTCMQTWLVCIIMFDVLYQFRNFDQFCRCLLDTIPDTLWLRSSDPSAGDSKTLRSGTYLVIGEETKV